MNEAKANWFREKTLAKRHLDKWKGLAKLMAKKRQLRELEKPKAKSREKINVFLKNLQEAVKKSEPDKSKLVKENQKNLKPKMTVAKEKTKKTSEKEVSTPAKSSSAKTSRTLKPLTPMTRSKSASTARSEEVKKEEVAESKPGIRFADDNYVKYMKPLPGLDSVKGYELTLNERISLLKQSKDRIKLDEREIKALEKISGQLEKGYAVTDTQLYHLVLSGVNCVEDNFENQAQNSSTKSGSNRGLKPLGRYPSHEIRAGEVLQLRLQADLHDNDFAKKSRHYETDCSVSRSRLTSGNSSKTTIRNIDIKDFGPRTSEDMDDPNEAK